MIDLPASTSSWKSRWEEPERQLEGLCLPLVQLEHGTHLYSLDISVSSCDPDVLDFRSSSGHFVVNL